MPHYGSISAVSGQHFIAASIPEANEPAISQCAIDLGKAGQWTALRNNKTELAKQCAFPGISAEYFLWLADMLNFTFDIRTPDDGSYGKLLDDGRWDGVVGMLARNEADLSFHPLFMTLERFGFVDYGPLVSERPIYGFLYKNPSSSTGLFSIFYPLNWSIYTVVCASFVVSLVAALVAASFSYTNSKKPPFSDTLISIVWRMLEMDPAALKTHFSFRIGLILFSWFLAAYTLANAYRSNLIVSAISGTDNLPLRNIDDATRLLRSNQIRLVVPKDNLLEFYNVLEALPAVSVEYTTWAGLLSNYSPIVANDSSEMASYLSQAGYAYFGDVRSVTWLFVKTPPSSVVMNLDLILVKTAQGAETDSLIFRKNFPYLQEFRAAMITMMTDTMDNQLEKKYFPERYQRAGAAGNFDNNDDSAVVERISISTDASSLEFWQLVELFGIWSIGCGLGVLTFLIEYIGHRRLAKKHLRREGSETNTRNTLV